MITYMIMPAAHCPWTTLLAQVMIVEGAGLLAQQTAAAEGMRAGLCAGMVCQPPSASDPSEP